MEINSKVIERPNSLTSMALKAAALPSNLREWKDAPSPDSIKSILPPVPKTLMDWKEAYTPT